MLHPSKIALLVTTSHGSTSTGSLVSFSTVARSVGSVQKWTRCMYWTSTVCRELNYWGQIARSDLLDREKQSAQVLPAFQSFSAKTCLHEPRSRNRKLARNGTFIHSLFTGLLISCLFCWTSSVKTLQPYNWSPFKYHMYYCFIEKEKKYHMYVARQRLESAG